MVRVPFPPGLLGIDNVFFLFKFEILGIWV